MQAAAQGVQPLPQRRELVSCARGASAGVSPPSSQSCAPRAELGKVGVGCGMALDARWACHAATFSRDPVHLPTQTRVLPWPVNNPSSLLRSSRWVITSLPLNSSTHCSCTSKYEYCSRGHRMACCCNPIQLVLCHSVIPRCSCTSKYEYCSGGNTYSCRGGHVCEKFAPCVWPSYDPCIVDPTADGCWNDCDKYPNAPGCADDPCTRVRWRGSVVLLRLAWGCRGLFGWGTGWQLEAAR